MLPENKPPFDPTDHLLPEGHPSGSAGPIFGIVIIIFLLIIGALYFWGAHLNAQNNRETNPPYIPPGPGADGPTSAAH